ncbi:hypothetical protein J7E38_17315 [Bacillus sp. ISL-35]|uniref:hypothetical protein n=1 Tax=Bacillus sp. ISL-35 TaxID=2819122 RepID=UPI001BE9C43C|nr:hypothetical protein [Bacillus sp. ISL-35]MBT2680773.1 hypothetical protein [Bacillus sp. ISL-35]MBT2705583.1 hypothetical protein [Chryseobacterium sp. ISL-80]
MAPAYHPEWLVNFWLTTPGLNLLNPHFVLTFLGVVIALLWFLKRKRTGALEVVDDNEKLFRHLLQRKRVIEEELARLDGRLSSTEIIEEIFIERKLDYQGQLDQVNKELKQYTG